MEKVELQAKIREQTGKKANKALRKDGLIPCVVYKQGEKTQPLFISSSDLYHALHTSAGENVLITLKIQKDSSAAKPKTVMIKEMQHHPFKEDVLHVDFHEISLHERLKVNVPIVTKGEAIGVKRDEGILEHILWELEVECLPTEIPEKIEVDVTEFEIGTSVHVKDLDVPTGITVLADPEQVVVTAAAPKIEEEAPAEGEEELAEPEVITEKKPKEGEEEVAGETPQGKEEKPPKEKEKAPKQDQK